jgi:hypothetical protein
MTTRTFVYTSNRTGEVGAWSQYLYPFHLDNYCHMDGKLYLRAGDDVLMVDETTAFDYAGHANASTFDGIIQWPYLDFGQPGVKKRFVGIDVAMLGAATVVVSIGYNQNDRNAFTVPYTIPGDTVPGKIIAIPLVAESFSLRLRMSSLDFWKFQSATVYLNDERVGA